MKYYSIGEVCGMLEVKPHVLRYWEQAIPALAPRKNQFGTRLYTRRDIHSFMRVKHLLYQQKYTVEGAAERLVQEMAGSQANQIALIEEIRENLLRLLEDLEQSRQKTRGAGNSR
ncbi:MAG: MerR family transcriptional regulator [Spirochaetales bacterium]|nr:MerR family transcriptional regulator [Spirochaetales bacterium]